MNDLKAQYEAMSIPELERVLREAVLTSETKAILVSVLAEKRATDPNAVPSSVVPSVTSTVDDQATGFRLSSVMKGAGAVVAFYILGSAFYWATGIGRVTDAILPPHIFSVIGFILAAKWRSGSYIFYMLAVFGVSYFLCGIYEDIWRQVILGKGYMWEHHWWTFRHWVIAFILGTILGKAFSWSKVRQPIPHPPS